MHDIYIFVGVSNPVHTPFGNLRLIAMDGDLFTMKRETFMSSA